EGTSRERVETPPRPRPGRVSAKDPFLEEAERELEEAIRGARNGQAGTSRVGPRPDVRSADAEARRWVEERQGRRPGGARRTNNAGPGRGPSASQIAQYYATLILPNGASLERVKDSYRRLMRDYHPDRYISDPERHRVATEVSQRLSRAYMELRRHLGDH